MVIKSPFQKLAPALTALLLSAGAVADTVTLKNGDKVQGKVISENDKEVVIEEQVTAGITDTRSIPRSDVAKVEKISEDEPAYQAIKNLKPGANSLPGPSYEQVIKSLNAFINNFSQSTHLAAVKDQLKTWEDEKKRVDAGEVKLDGKWLGKEEAEKERYQISGQVIFNHMQQQYRQGDLSGALNSFDQLERNFPGARTFPDAVELAKQIVPRLKSSAERSLQNLKYQETEREKGLQLLSEAQRSETLAGVEREKQRAEAAAEAASKAGLKWPPLVPNEKALTDISSKAQDEQRRLAELPVPKMKESIQLVAKARTAAGEKKFEEAEATLRQALEAWNANELATRLQGELSTMKTASTETPAETPAEEPPAETTEAPAAEAPAPAPVESAASTASTEAAASEEVTEENTEAEEEPGFFQTAGGMVALAVLGIIGIAGFSAFRKISKRASEVIE